jgi:cytochrome d ubiquinol oxidase subunit II
MLLPDLCVGFVLLGLVAYAVLGGADYGAGFWDLTAGGPERGAPIRAMVQRSMAPVWEANHVWLIYVLVLVWTAFPVAFGSIFSTLTIPLFLAAVGIIFRGAAFALRGQAATMREARALGATFALSSVLIPFFLGAALGGIASGRVRVGNAAGDLVSSWVNPTSAIVGAIAVVAGTHLSAVYLSGDARRVGRPDIVRAFRVRAIGSGVVAGMLSLAGLAVLRSDARQLFDGLTSGVGLAMVIVSALAGLVTLALVAAGRYDVARGTVALAVAAIAVGWVFAQDPYLLPPELTLAEAAAPDSTLRALVIGVGLGFVILVPSLAYLFRLTLQGRLDQDFEPLEQRFKALPERRPEREPSR